MFRGVPRFEANISPNAAKGTDMTTVLMEFIQNYVAKHGPAPQKKGRRA